MANDSNYIGAAMGLDVTDLKAGLSEANKQIQLANSEFKAASSGMDDWSKSTEGITAKVKQLDTVLQMQKSKLAGLKAEYEKVVKSQGENSEAARKLKVQINNQQAVVNKTQKEFNNYSETLKEAEAGNIDLEKVVLRNGKALKEQGDAAKESGSKLDGLKSVAGGVVKGIAAIGAAAVAAVSGFLSLAESTREFREDTAKLNSAFEAAKLSADSASATYKALFGAIGESDTAVEASQQIALLANSEEEAAKWAELATGVVGTFGDALKAETFYEAANETIKLGEATGAFTQMLEGTGASVDEFNAGLAACTTEEEKQAYMLEISNKLLGDAGAAYNETAKDIIEAREAEAELTQAMAELGAIAEPIMTTLKLLAVDLIDTIKPFVELIGEGLKGALEGTAGSTEMLAEGIQGVFNSLLEKITSLLPTVLDVVLQLLPALADSAVQMVQTLSAALLENLPQILNAAIEIVLTLVRGISDMLPTLIPAVVDAIILIVETLIDNLDKIIDAGIELILALADGLIKALPKLIAKIPVIIDKLMTAISKNQPKLLEAGIKLLVALASGLIKAIPDLLKAIPKIIKSIVDGFADSKSNMLDVGLNLLKGIWEGIKDGAGWLKDKITGFAGDVAGWFKKTFKISSPSKLMADEVGEYIGEGIGVGVLDSIPTVKKQLGKFAGFVQDNLGGIKSGLSIGANGSGGGYATGRGNTVVNAGMTVNYNGTLSRKQLKQIENDQYTRVKMKLKAEGAI
ncbi:MAG: hypothetical protein ACI4MS_02690 [Candidatus Coproplasma sp.]